ELRLDARTCPSLPEGVKARLEALAGARLTQEGVIVLFSQGSRSQEMNRQEGREPLFALFRRAAIVPKRRRPTRPTLASKTRRLDAKTRRARLKSTRGRPIGES